jgi:hypothetical protein
LTASLLPVKARYKNQHKKHTGDARFAAPYPYKTKPEQTMTETGTTQTRNTHKKRDKKHEIAGLFTGYMPHFYQHFNFFSFPCIP